MSIDDLLLWPSCSLTKLGLAALSGLALSFLVQGIQASVLFVPSAIGFQPLLLHIHRHQECRWENIGLSQGRHARRPRQDRPIMAVEVRKAQLSRARNLRLHEAIKTAGCQLGTAQAGVVAIRCG